MSMIPVHGLQWFTPLHWLGLKTGRRWLSWVGVALGVMAMQPDLIAMPETMFGKWDNLYQWSHGILGHEIAWSSLWMNPPYMSHLAIDSWYHHPTEGGWVAGGYIAETVQVGFFLWFFRGEISIVFFWVGNLFNKMREKITT